MARFIKIVIRVFGNFIKEIHFFPFTNQTEFKVETM